ncbi:MAG: hypothetical protein IKP65_04810 [Alphaproteobacteria bacterium]|nr:hypothetical protein [Alphaproteobacteria bacterium]
MKKYNIIKDGTIIDLNESVMLWINQYGYEIIGGAFWDGYAYCQTVVKYSD